MAKKNKHTTFVIPKGLTVDEHRKVILEALGWEYLSGETAQFHPDLNAQFMSRSYNPYVSPITVMFWGDVNKAFERVGVQDFYLKYIDGSTSLYSKKLFKYGAFGFRAKLPDPADPAFLALFLGAETTGGTHGGIASFNFNLVAGVIRTSVANYSINKVGYLWPNVSALMPVVPSAGLYNYLVKINRASVEYWVESSLIGIVQFAPESDTYNVRTTAPYYLGQVKGHCPCFMPALVEWFCTGAGYIGKRSNIQLQDFWITDGEPAPPRTLHPITSGVNWEGTVVAGATITSDGVPIVGYKHKTVYFLATGAGTLGISVDYGDNAYDSITPTPLTVVANQLLTYPTENDGLWMRLIYTPTTPPQTITRARVMMSD